MVIALDAQAAVTPAGRAVGVPIPVARVVVWVMLANKVLIHSVGAEDAPPAVMAAVTVIVPVAATLPQPPVNGML
jgi:hypothetical protein